MNVSQRVLLLPVALALCELLEREDCGSEEEEGEEGEGRGRGRGGQVCWWSLVSLSVTLHPQLGLLPSPQRETLAWCPSSARKIKNKKNLR